MKSSTREWSFVDDQLRVVFANEALITNVDSTTSRNCRAVRPTQFSLPEDIPYIIRQHKSGHRYGRHRSEFYFPRKDGKRIPAIFSGRVIQGPDGQDYVVLIVTDISELKRVEEQLRKASKGN